MSSFVPWNSQSMDEWAAKHARGQFIDLDGRKTHYLDVGRGDPLVLVHGFNMDLLTWVENIEPLAERFRVLALDLWGLGYSTREPLDYGYELYSEQLRLFMDALGLEYASLAGHSMGGGTSVVFALKYPNRVNKLVLVDSVGYPAPLPFRAKIFRLPGVAEFLVSLPTDFVRRKNLSDFWVYDPAALTESRFQEFMSFQKIEGTNESILAILRKDFFHTLEDQFATLGEQDIPTLIIWGNQDSSVPLSSGQAIERLIKGSRLEIIDNAGHMPNFEKPQIFNQLVSDFLLDRPE